MTPKNQPVNRMNKILLCGLLFCLKGVAKVRGIASRRSAGWLPLAGILMASVPGVEAGDPVVSKVQAAQRPGTHKVDIRYDVADADGDALWITVKVSDDGGTTYAVPAASFSGDNGFGIKPGSGKHIVWDAGVDWGGKYSANMRFRVTANDSFSKTMSWIRPGNYTMGSPRNENGRQSHEGPQTKVTISKGFWMGKYEVTQEEFKSLMGTNPSQFKGELNLPVDTVTWNEAMSYCERYTLKNKREGLLPDGYEYRLPTSAEWEYACRAGTTTRFNFGNDESQLGEYAWYVSNSNNRTHPVGQKNPNRWGLYDMHGNLWEWCLDWYYTYPGGSVIDPRGPNTGEGRVMNRGGGWAYDAKVNRSAHYDGNGPGNRYFHQGFRIVLAPVGSPVFALIGEAHAGSHSAESNITMVETLSPSIMTQPFDQIVTVDSTVTLSVEARGLQPLGYQWKRDGVDLGPTTNNPILTLEKVQIEHAGIYQVTITNKHGSVISDEAVLKVVTPGAPQIFADGKEVVGSVVKGDKVEISLTTSFEGGSIYFTADGSEPSFESTLYKEPFTITETSVIRALAYSVDFSDYAESDPVVVNIVHNYVLNAEVSGQGSVIKEPSLGKYIQDSVVKVKAIPDEGWRFLRWEGGLTGAFEKGTLVMDGDTSITAVFEPIPKFTLEAQVLGEGFITGNKSKGYYGGETVQLSLNIGDGWELMHWDVKRLSDEWVLSGHAKFFQDFNQLKLGPFVSDSESGGDGTDWTPVAPAGWIMKPGGNHGPTAGGDAVVEFDGWTFLDPVSWNSTAGQDRAQFTKGSGVIAVADSDESDDKADAKFNASLSTPRIDISGAEEGSLVLIYDSSWRQEPQTGEVTVSFDGGDPITLLTLTPDTQTAYNETVTLELNNPAGAKTAVITWQYSGHNNWWWAIDNILVSTKLAGGSPPTKLTKERKYSLERHTTDSENIFADSAIPNALIREGLIAYWPFDGDLKDAIGDSHGTGMGSDDIVYDTGQFGQGIDLDGIDQFIETPVENEEMFDFQDGTGFSVSAWFRVDGFTKSWQALISKGEENRWRIHRRGGESIMTGNGGNGDVSAGTTDVNDGEIHHVVLVSDPDGGEVRFYVDDELEATGASPNIESNDNPMMIGESPDARNRTWDGLIDDVAIWKRALSDSEVSALNKYGINLDSVNEGFVLESEINTDIQAVAVLGTSIDLGNSTKGSIKLEPQEGPYAYGSKVRVIPVPAAGYYLGAWGGDVAGMDKGPIEIEITKANPKITALFVPLKENRFTLTVLPSKGGVVNSSPSSNVYTNGDEVTFTATASAGYSFSSWTGDIESTDNLLVTLADANKTIQPVFTPNVFAPVVLKG